MVIAEILHANPPDECDLCETPIRDNFIEGMTRHGVPAKACLRCARVYGLDLLDGSAQLYSRQSSGSFVLVLT
jgi:hypothetical protein